MALEGTVRFNNAAMARLFESEDGRYTIRVDPAWTKPPGGVANGIEVWAVGERSGGFPPNRPRLCITHT